MQIQRSIFFDPAEAIAGGFSAELTDEVTIACREQQQLCFLLSVEVSAEEGFDVAAQFLRKGCVTFSLLKLLQSEIDQQIFFARAKRCCHRLSAVKPFEES